MLKVNSEWKQLGSGNLDCLIDITVVLDSIVGIHNFCLLPLGNSLIDSKVVTVSTDQRGDISIYNSLRGD